MREKRREEQLHNPHYLKGSTSSKSPRVSNVFVSYWYNLSLDNIISRSVNISAMEIQYPQIMVFAWELSFAGITPWHIYGWCSTVCMAVLLSIPARRPMKVRPTEFTFWNISPCNREKTCYIYGIALPVCVVTLNIRFIFILFLFIYRVPHKWQLMIFL